MKYYAGIDLGGKYVRTVIADEHGEFLGDPLKEEHYLDDGPLGISDQIMRMMMTCAERSSISLDGAAAVGISSAGPLDLGKFGGSIQDSTNIKFPEVEHFDGKKLPDSYFYQGKPLLEFEGEKGHLCIPLVEPLRDYLRKPIFLGNDVSTAVIGVVMFGEGKEYGDPYEKNYAAVVTTHGTGFGGGVWARGGVVEGVGGNAAEVGHYKVVEDGRKCGCGKIGCAETFGSGSGVVSNAVAKLRNYGFDSEVYRMAKERALVDFTEEEICNKRCLPLHYLDAKMVFDTFRKNPEDVVAREVVEEAGKYIGRAYGMIACSYNPFFIATYGGMTKSWNLLEERVLEEMKASTNVSPLPEVFVTSLDDDAGLKGAVGRALGLGR